MVKASRRFDHSASLLEYYAVPNFEDYDNHGFALRPTISLGGQVVESYYSSLTCWRKDVTIAICSLPTLKKSMP